MKAKLIYGLLAAFLLTVGLVLAAGPGLAHPSQGRAHVTLPANAVEVAPGIYSLGTALDNGRVVEGYAIIKYKDGSAAPAQCDYDGVCETGEKRCSDCSGASGISTCYGFLAKGAKWKAGPEPYTVYPANTQELNGADIKAILDAGIGKWEAAAGKDILGLGTIGDVYLGDMDVLNDKNEVIFGDIDYNGAIAITYIWGIWGGPVGQRALVEWDQVYDDADFDWSMSETGVTDRMDFDNIATHELGHSVGMGDLYDTKCADQTMYGYASNGEIKKRDLAAGDIAGVKALYST